MINSIEEVNEQIQSELLAVVENSWDKLGEYNEQSIKIIDKLIRREYEHSKSGKVPSVYLIYTLYLTEMLGIILQIGEDITEKYANQLPDHEKIAFYDERIKDYIQELTCTVYSFIEKRENNSVILSLIEHAAINLGFCISLFADFEDRENVFVGDAQLIMGYDFSFMGRACIGDNMFIDINKRNNNGGALIG